ncbi:MAG: hypothetical protein AAB431_01020 [Patescibacteria group bacterium]
MMMTRKKRITIVAAIFIVVILLLIWFFLLLWPQGTSNTPSSDTQTPVTQEEKTSTPTPEEQKLIEKQEDRMQSSEVTTVARTFVERYGSYSNEANFQNTKDVLPLMTDAFASATQQVIDTSKPPATYYGVTTNVIVLTVEKNDDAAATVLLNTQRIIAQGSTQNSAVSYQKIRLELLKQSGTWKVDSATWL